MTKTEHSDPQNGENRENESVSSAVHPTRTKERTCLCELSRYYIMQDYCLHGSIFGAYKHRNTQ